MDICRRGGFVKVLDVENVEDLDNEFLEEFVEDFDADNIKNSLG